MSSTSKKTSWEHGLWPHQIEAVNKIRKYIKSNSKGSALIRMPTGTGKSGIIAVVTQCFKDTPNSLVVVPGKYLKKQLEEDIKEKFWKTIGISPENFPKREVKSFLPSTIKEIPYKSRETNTIFICTIQTLQKIYSKEESKKIYDKLRKKISIVIFDEGHREPAPKWAKAVRNLKKPTILFSATPYRNDYKQFNIDPNYIFVYTYQQAVKNRYIREVEFHEAKYNSPENFVEELLKFYEKFKNNLNPDNNSEPRVIIRCKTNTDVNKIASILKQKGRKVIAIHDCFTNDKKDFHRRDVPNLRKADFTFWVHQYKLIEGVDDPRFRILAIYQPLKNAKQLVQQVGRIIRNPGQKERQKAYILTKPSDKQKDYWSGYLEYEKRNVRAESAPQQIFDEILRILPKYSYVKSNYRKRFDFNEKDLYKQFIYPLSANIYEIENTFSIQSLSKAIRKEWPDKDIDVRKEEIPDNNTVVFTYVKYGNSPILHNRYLFTYDIGFTIAHVSESYLFFYDTYGNSCSYLTKNTKKVNPDVLEHLFYGKGTRISEISLVNMDLGRHSIRRRTLHARSLEDTAPNLVDYANFVSTSCGYVRNKDKQQIQRYIGFTRAKISDHSAVYCKYKDYIKWLGSLAKIIKHGKKSPTLFNRFASLTNPPKDPTPINILLDIDDACKLFETTEGGKALYVDEVCREIKNGKFDLTANSNKYTVGITYDKNKKVYKLQSSKLKKAYTMKETEERRRVNLVAYLNLNQSFRIIPKTSGIIYAYSKFYKPNLPIAGKNTEFPLLSILNPIDKLENIHHEKEIKGPKDDKWEEGTLFHLIDNPSKGTELEQLGRADILVCDDMGTEIADFVVANTGEKRVVLIHAKAFKQTRSISASAFQEVCSQATKNLEIIHPLSDKKPSKLASWDKLWKGKVKRIRKGGANGQDVWGKIRTIIRDPSSSREVWIILGAGFSKGKFETELHKSNPKPQIIQIIYLLQSTWSAVSSIGAKFKIFCSP